MQPDGNLQRVEAIPPDRVVDTRAAGDVFNAAYIDASLKAHTAQQRLQAAMALATHKCTQSGIDTLVRK
jgi:sugar/nucleoside kinase (ribokinase family)